MFEKLLLVCPFSTHDWKYKYSMTSNIPLVATRTNEMMSSIEMKEPLKPIWVKWFKLILVVCLFSVITIYVLTLKIRNKKSIYYTSFTITILQKNSASTTWGARCEAGVPFRDRGTRLLCRGYLFETCAMCASENELILAHISL